MFVTKVYTKSIHFLFFMLQCIVGEIFMIKCIVDGVQEFNTYVLKTDKQKFNVMFEFYGIEKLKKGDSMLLNESLLDKNSKLYTQPFAFEKVEGLNLKNIIKENNIETICKNNN